MRNTTFLGCMGYLFMLFLYICLITWLLSMLWPWIVPAVFPGLVANGSIAAELTFWQYWGVSVLCAFLFKPGGIKVNSKD